MARKSLPTEVRQLVLHEAGYRCSNPVCRMPLTLDIHHLDYVSKGGTNTSENLIPLCPNCHTLHHQGNIPINSLKAWKMILLSLNEGFRKQSIDLLLALDDLEELTISGDGMLNIPDIFVSKLVEVKTRTTSAATFGGTGTYKLVLSKKGKLFVKNWKLGDQKAAINV